MPRESKIWLHFEKNKDGGPKCKVCKKTVKSTGNTSNLAAHLKYNHKEIFESCFKHKGDSSQPRINAVIEEMESFKEGGDLNAKVNLKLAWWMVFNAHPFRIVEQRGFKDMMKVLNKNYRPPCRETFKSIISKLYEQKIQELKFFLTSVKFVSITSDGWKDVSNQNSYVGVTIHFVDDYKLFSACLQVDQFKGEATAAQIQHTILSVCEKFDIQQDRIVCVTTDGAPNYMKAAQNISANIHCVAHTLNLIVEDSLESDISLVQMIESVRNIVTAFKKSSKMMDDLMEERLNNNKEPLKLIQDVVTRWNSTYLMISRYLELHQEISVILVKHSKRDLDIDELDIFSLRQVATVLEPFFAMTEDISGESYVTISRIIPLISSVKVFMAKMRNVDATACNLKEKLITGLEKRLGNIEKDDLFAFSTLLDPRFKKLDFSSPSDCARKVTKLISMLGDVDLTQKTYSDDVTPGIWEIHDRKVSKLSSSSSGYDNALKHYLQLDVLNRNDDPLKFWRDNKTNWPELHNLAMKYLCVQPTSVPSERLFSKAGSIINEKRNRISPKNVNMLMFLSSLPDSLI